MTRVVRIDNRMTKWDKRFLEIATNISTWSKDRSTKVGCVIVGPHSEIRSVGYNGFPRGVDDNIDSRHERPIKYKWTEHAERNAIFNAVLSGITLHDCTLYNTWYPCADCARAIIQTGIRTVVCGKAPDNSNPTYIEDFKVTHAMFSEVGITVILPEVV